MSEQYSIVLCTCPNEETARQLADSIISGKLAGCVNIVPAITSVYPWNGKIEISPESLLLIKTRKDVYAALESHIKANHPYELPEVIAVPIDCGRAPYLEWIDSWLNSKN